MLTRLRLTNYQSHRDTQLDLGNFTVIVGASSSGKSAVVRALRVLVSNSRGTSYVRHGSRTARVWGAFAQFEGDPLDAQIQVAVERGSGMSVYELTIPGEDLLKFTKCGTAVPDIVSAAYDLGEDDMWLAGQFDRPFLLDSTGSLIARVLGDLTNVSMIFAAVRECNRRASGAKSRLTERTVDLERARVQLRDYLDLPAKLSACSGAEAALARAEALAQRRDRLSVLYEDAVSAVARASEARSRLRFVPCVELLVVAESRRSRLAEMVRTVDGVALRRAAISLVSVPDLARLGALSGRRTGLHTMLAELGRSEVSRRQAVERAGQARAAAEEAREYLVRSLAEAGICPTCGASTAHAQVDRVSSGH